MSGATKPSPRVPGYELGERIGSGGFSTVYRAYDPKFDRVVAIKLLNLAVSDPAAQRRFLRECRLMGRLGSHPHVLTVFAADVLDDDRPYIVMEYLEGGTIAEHVPLPEAEVLRVGVLVGSALASVHAANVVHRDVKPQNILLSGFGQPVLGDFGVSGVIDQGGAVSNPMALSPLYAAPEAFHGMPDAGSDQYSLAATLYALLTGRSPAEGDPEEPLTRIMLRVLEEEPAPLPPSVAHPRLASALGRALRTPPSERFADVGGLVAELQAVQHDLGGPVTAAVGVTSAPAGPAPLGGGARVTTRPPLGGAGPDPGPAAASGPASPPSVDPTDHADTGATRPAAWPDPVGGAGGPDPAPVAARRGDDTRPGASPPRRPRDEARAASDIPTSGPGSEPPFPEPRPDEPASADGSEASDRRRRRSPLLPIAVIIALGVAVALVAAVLLAPRDEPLIQTQPTSVRLEPVLTADQVDDPTAPRDYRLTWDGPPDEAYFVVRYAGDAPGVPDIVEEAFVGTTLMVSVADGTVPTCFFVAAEADRERLRVAGGDPARAEQRDDDGCTSATRVAEVANG